MSTNYSEEFSQQWISQAEAARLRGVSRQAIGRLIKHSRLQTLAIAGRLLVKRADIEDFKPEQAGRHPQKKKTRPK